MNAASIWFCHVLILVWITGHVGLAKIGQEQVKIATKGTHVQTGLVALASQCIGMWHIVAIVNTKIVKGFKP